MSTWNPENYICPYVSHGDKSSKSKKATVTIPIEIHEIIISEKKRRIANNMLHATISELLCEAFLHSYTGQPLPTDEELVSKVKLRRKVDDNL